MSIRLDLTLLRGGRGSSVRHGMLLILLLTSVSIATVDAGEPDVKTESHMHSIGVCSPCLGILVRMPLPCYSRTSTRTCFTFKPKSPCPPPLLRRWVSTRSNYVCSIPVVTSPPVRVASTKGLALEDVKEIGKAALRERKLLIPYARKH